MKNLNTIFFHKQNLFLTYLFIFVIFSLILFTRSFVGIYIFGFRLGEFFVVFGFLSSLFISLVIFSDWTVFSDKILISFKSLVFLFFLLAIFTKTNLAQPYAFRTSSYIWTISFIFVGSYFISKLNSNIFQASLVILFLVYLFSSGNYPEFLIDLFYKISDKFQFIKGSEITLAYISIILLNYKFHKNQRKNFIFLLFYAALFLPVLLVASRGAFLGLSFFLLFEMFFLKKFILKDLKYFVLILVLSIPLAIFSTLRVGSNKQIIEIIDNPQQEIEIAINDVVSKKDIPSAFLGFYITDYGYLDSTDPTTSWRLDIWQDVFVDMRSKNLFLTGYGYNEIIPVMTDPTAPGRLGWDGLNENVHNYFVNILARGGIFQLIITLFFHYQLIFLYRKRHGNLRIISFVLPILFIASLDAAMEGVNFPILFYSFYGYFIKNGIE